MSTAPNPYAFPHTTRHAEGMTLRDYLAGQALAGLMANERINVENAKTVTLLAYHIADVMLEERNK